MAFNEDDSEPLSSRRSLERSDHGKKERLEQKAKVNEKKDLFKLKRSVLQNNLKVDPKNQDDLTKNDRTFKTESHKEEEEHSTVTAKQKQNEDTLMHQQQLEKVVQQETQYEEEQQSGG